METLLSLIVWALCGFGCYVAENQGHTTAAVLGACLAYFAVIGYLIAGKKNV